MSVDWRDARGEFGAEIFWIFSTADCLGPAVGEFGLCAPRGDCGVCSALPRGEWGICDGKGERDGERGKDGGRRERTSLRSTSRENSGEHLMDDKENTIGGLIRRILLVGDKDNTIGR